MYSKADLFRGLEPGFVSRRNARFARLGVLTALLIILSSSSCQTTPAKKPTGPNPITETTATESAPAETNVKDEKPENPGSSTESVVNPVLDARRGAVAILPFRINGTENRELGAGISSRLMARLQSRNQFQIVERLDLDQIQKELVTGQSGLIDGDTAAKIGRLVGARYLVLGEWSDGVGNQKKGSYRIVVAETGRLIGSGISMGPEEQVLQNFEQSLARQLAIYQSLDNPESPYSILLQLDREDHLYRLGDRVEVSFEIKRYRNEAPARVYLQLYAIDSEGVMTMIYPNRFSGVKALEVGKKYTFPADSDPFEWKLVPPIGTETIQAFVTTEAVDPFKATEKMQDGFVQVSTRGHSLETFSGIVTVLKEEETEGWSADRITFEIQD